MALGQEDQARRRSPRAREVVEHAEVAGARSALALAEEGRKAKGQLQTLQARWLPTRQICRRATIWRRR